jgi:hypothetical protein
MIWRQCAPYCGATLTSINSPKEPAAITEKCAKLSKINVSHKQHGQCRFDAAFSDACMVQARRQRMREYA